MRCHGTVQPCSDLTLHVEVEGGRITRVSFDGAGGEADHPLIREAGRQLAEYFAGRRREFDLPLEMRGTAFQKRVWEALLAIPYGETRSYLEVARAVGVPAGSRAVGAANGANPIAIVVPCHRVVNAGGGLGGYGGGLDLKRRLLELERGMAVLNLSRG